MMKPWLALASLAAPAYADDKPTVYGHLDVSIDDTTKGFHNADDAVGANGWMAAVSTNLSYVGVRGTHTLSCLDFIYQLETGLDISATSGTVNTSANSASIVKGALTSRDSFIGFTGDWGTVKVGKMYAPYR